MNPSDSVPVQSPGCPPVEAFPPKVKRDAPTCRETTSSTAPTTSEINNNDQKDHNWSGGRFRRANEENNPVTSSATVEGRDKVPMVPPPEGETTEDEDEQEKTQRFQRGDHVYQWCSLLGIPGVFQHHGIVMHVEDMPPTTTTSAEDETLEEEEEEVQQFITIVDFSNLLLGNKEESSAEHDDHDDFYEVLYEHEEDEDTVTQEEMWGPRPLEEESKEALHEGLVVEGESNPIPNNGSFAAGRGSMPFFRSGSSALSSCSNIKTTGSKDRGWLRVYTTTTSTKDGDKKKWHKVAYQDHWFHTHLWKRSGTCTPASSDPPDVVMKRVNFLLSQSNKLHPYGYESSDLDTNHNKEQPPHQSLLPEYHSIYSNCECVAVWCKTGTWSTLQAASFLSAAAATQVKGTATIAGIAAAQTVSVPAAGVWGWLGYTTTVPLMTVNPFVFPAICAYGAITVGGPAICLAVAKSKWKATTKRLNDALDAESLELDLVT